MLYGICEDGLPNKSASRSKSLVGIKIKGNPNFFCQFYCKFWLHRGPCQCLCADAHVIRIYHVTYKRMNKYSKVCKKCANNVQNDA